MRAHLAIGAAALRGGLPLLLGFLLGGRCRQGRGFSSGSEGVSRAGWHLGGGDRAGELTHCGVETASVEWWELRSGSELRNGEVGVDSRPCRPERARKLAETRAGPWKFRALELARLVHSGRDGTSACPEEHTTHWLRPTCCLASCLPRARPRLLATAAKLAPACLHTSVCVCVLQLLLKELTRLLT